MFESELNPPEVSQIGSKTKTSWSRTFNSAGEFLESVEDSRESVWLVHIVKNDDEREFNKCSNESTRFVSNSTWHRLNSHLSKFGILTGIFNCAHDEYFCRIKGWHEPQLVLGLLKYDLYRSPKEFVQFHTYKNCQRNDYDGVFRWVRYRLEKADRPPSSSTDLQVPTNTIIIFSFHSDFCLL